jgi:hypothetical protein
LNPAYSIHIAAIGGRLSHAMVNISRRDATIGKIRGRSESPLVNKKRQVKRNNSKPS